MVEAAMVLPLLILSILTLMMVMTHYHQSHQKQIDLHQDLLGKKDSMKKVFHIERQAAKTATKLDGIVHILLKEEKTHRIYVMQPSSWIQLGEMVDIYE